MPAKRVLSVGQCGADHGSLTRMLRQHFGATVVAADSTEEALTALHDEPFDLVLVNRVLDLDGSCGMTLIQQMKADAALRQLPVMLVSNYEDSQREAIQAGAERGFGKGALGHPQTIERLRAFLQ